MKNSDAKKGQLGFTLIELMIAMVVTVLALVGFVGAGVAVQQGDESAFERTIALQDANQVVERMRNTALTGNFPTNVVAVYPNNGLVAGFNGLTNEQIRVVYANTAANPLDVTVTVTWLERGRRAVNTSLRSLLTQRL